MRLRRVLNSLGLAAVVALAVVAVAPLFLIIADVYVRGVSAIAELGGLGFFTSIPPSPYDARGGIGPHIVGSLFMTLLGAVIGFAVGFPIGVFIGEFRRGFAVGLARAGVHILVEFPTVAVGLFVYAVFSVVVSGWVNAWLQSLRVGGWLAMFVGPLDQFNAYAGALALAIVMVPYVALFTASAYASIEQPVREAAYAVAGREYRAVFVVLRKAVSRAVLSAALLGTAKIAGETAPLLFTALGNMYYGPFTRPTAAIPLWVWYAAQTPYEVLQKSAYGAAAVLLTIVLVLFLVARAWRR